METAKAARVVTRSLGAFIDEERENDLLEVRSCVKSSVIRLAETYVLQKPRITRIEDANAVDIMHEDFEQDFDGGEPLIDDIYFPSRTTLPLAIKYWPESNETGTADPLECFTKLPYILPQVAEDTGVDIVLEKQHMRVRVSSTQAAAVGDVMKKLDNLSISLVSILSPVIAPSMLFIYAAGQPHTSANHNAV